MLWRRKRQTLLKPGVYTARINEIRINVNEQGVALYECILDQVHKKKDGKK